MECAIISDESSDVDMKTMKDQLSEFGLDDEHLSKEEMSDLLKALKNSKSTVKEDELLRLKVDEPTATSPQKTLKRRYKNVADRRMPWSVLPNNLTHTEKARVLAVYIKIMSTNSYWQARQKSTFAAWPPPMQIVEESSSRLHSLRSTRSGRSVPLYCADLDDDSSDDFVATKPKKRKVSGSDNDGVYSNKVVSLKRTSKDVNSRSVKEMKLNTEKRDIFTFIED